MDAAVLVARLLLASVFTLAAVTKLRDRAGTERAISDFGVSRRYVRRGALLLPVLELAIAGTLLIDPLAQAAAVGALVLLGVFTAAIVNALRRSRAPDCGCFGNLTSKPVSGWTAGRNIALGCVALFVAFRGPGTSLALPLELLIVAALVTPAVLLGDRRRPAEEALSAPSPAPKPEWRGIPLGEPAPDFELTSPGDETVSLGSLRSAGLPVVLLFLSSGCGACRELHPHLHRWQVALAERMTIAVIMNGDADAARVLCTEHDVQHVLVDDGGSPLWESYRMPGTPSGVRIAPDGRVASAAVRGAEALEELVRQTIRHESQTAAQWTQPTPVA
jgi:uncharacterized membrane protein YphA (DoxX/SURF4 family)/peroxiredoxin